MTRPEQIADLVTLATLLEGMAHDHLSIATDINGRPGVALAPSVAEQVHLLVREVARRARELEGAQ